MSYRIDPTDENAIVMEGVENGISDNPYQGISDMRNVNIISVPGEASVNFSTSKVSGPSVNGTMTDSSASNDTVTLAFTGTLSTGQSISFSVVSDPTKGITTLTYYWVETISGGTNGGVYKLHAIFSAASSPVNITADGLTGTWATYNMGLPKYFQRAMDSSSNWMIDANGRVWTDLRGDASKFWAYTGNKPNNFSGGNGLVYYQSEAGIGYMFAFSDSSIDYTPTTATTVSWLYQWQPQTSPSTALGYNANPTAILKSAAVNSLAIHEAMVAPDNKVYFCDKNWIGRWYQAALGSDFDPATKATFIFDETSILPFTDIAQCLTVLGNTLLVGGTKNVIYPWDTFSQLPQYPILIAENSTQKLITVNTNAYAFAGNRGRIYITNGSQASLYKKIPDHISGTVEPYFTWGGVTSAKNQIYFGFSCKTNSGTVNNNYGGVWAIDVDTQALREVNKLSFDTYLGIANCIMPNFISNPAGTGIFIGWCDGTGGTSITGNFGVDTTVSTPYTGSQASIDFDLIPIATFYRQKVFKTVEYKLSVPMVNGESVSIYARERFSDSFTLVFTDTATSSPSYLPFSGNHSVNFDNSQWIQLRAVLNSTSTNPSFTRLKEIRIK